MAVMPALSHEVVPAIVSFETQGNTVIFTADMPLEPVISGIDLSRFTDTNDAPQVEDHDRLRALSPDALETEFRAAWPSVSGDIQVLFVANTPAALSLRSVDIDDVPQRDFPRSARVTFTAQLPVDAAELRFGWAERLGNFVLRQENVANPFTKELDGGDLSPQIALIGGDARTQFEIFADYIPAGFDHIIPKGLDHIVFVLGLFFFSLRLSSLLWQVSAFTLAHSVTLALAATGTVNISGAIVEPLIAASIVFIAVENIIAKGMTPWRPVIVFGFGLLHGLGFASVLADYGLPDNGFWAALIGFNIGVEVGQLTVIAVAYILLGVPFGKKPWYRKAISVPASVLIGLIGVWWLIERTLL